MKLIKTNVNTMRSQLEQSITQRENPNHMTNQLEMDSVSRQENSRSACKGDSWSRIISCNSVSYGRT